MFITKPYNIINICFSPDKKNLINWLVGAKYVFLINKILSYDSDNANEYLANLPNLTLDQALLLIKNKIIPTKFLAKNALQNNKTASKYDKLLKIANSYKLMAEQKYSNLLHYYNSSY